MLGHGKCLSLGWETSLERALAVDGTEQYGLLVARGDGHILWQELGFTGAAAHTLEDGRDDDLGALGGVSRRTIAASNFL